MANLFIGFPVARAKIADMIAGAAPPTDHASQHESGGSDEIDCTDLIGAGGGVDVSDEGVIFYNTYLEGLVGINQSLGGAGAINNMVTYVQLDTTNTQDSYAEMFKQCDYLYAVASWAKARTLRAFLKLVSLTTWAGTGYFFSGYFVSNIGFGFEMTGGKLYAISIDGANKHSEELITLAGGGNTQEFMLKAILDPGVNVKYYIDGVLVATITDNLPTGETYAHRLWEAKIANAGIAEREQIYIGNITVIQAA